MSNFVINPFVTGITIVQAFIYISGGQQTSGSAIVSTSDKYNFGAPDTSVSSTALGAIRFAAQTASNSTFGLVASGSTTALASSGMTAVDKFTWLTMVRTSGTALTASVFNGFGMGNGTKGVFGGGQNAASATVTTTYKYTYTGDVVAGGGALTDAINTAGVGNATYGIVVGLAFTTKTNKYTYSTDVVTVGTALGDTKYTCGAAGNTTRAIYAAGMNGSSVTVATSRKYTYSGETTAAGGSLGTAKNQLCGAGTDTIGLFAGGIDSAGTTNLGTTHKYTFSSDTAAAAVTMTTQRNFGSAMSSIPGGF